MDALVGGWRFLWRSIFMGVCRFCVIILGVLVILVIFWVVVIIVYVVFDAINCLGNGSD